MCKTLVAFCAASFLEIFVSIIRLFTEVMPLKDNGKGSGSDDAPCMTSLKVQGHDTI